MKKTYLELKGEVERYWLSRLNSLILTYGKDGECNSWIKINGNAVKECLSINFKDVEKFITDNISPFNIEGFLDDEQLIIQLYKAYEEIEIYHNARKRQLSPMVTALNNLYNEMPVIAHDHKDLSCSIECLSNMLEYSSIMLVYLDNWFSLFDISPEKLNKPKKLNWNTLLSKLVKALEAKGIQHTAACHTTAKLLAIIYPKIWGKDDLFENGELIRQKLYRLDNK